MAFNYSINIGKFSYYDNSFLVSTLGFSANAVNGLFEGANFAPDKFINEYKALFGTNLAISDGYKFFEATNTNHMDLFLTGDALEYTSNKEICRVEAYKELFLEKYDSAAAALTSQDITSGSIDTAYQFNGSALQATYTNTEFSDLYDQLEKEANLLKSELHESELAYGGYPEIGYSSSEAKTSLLKQQLDVATQEFLTIYDQLFGYYKIKAGGHRLDNDSADLDRTVREQEAMTAATMNAVLAINYAQKYYSQTVKPSTDDYVFGQAPIVLSRNVAGTRVGFDGNDQMNAISNILGDYSITPATNQFKNLFLDETAFSTFDPYTITNLTMQKDVTLASGDYNTLFWNMNQGIDSNYDGTNPTAGFNSRGTDGLVEELNHDKGSQLKDGQLSEIGDSIDEYINWMVRDTYAVGGLTADVKNTDYCSETATYLSKAIFDAAQKIVSLKMDLVTTNIETAINNQIRGEYEARLGAMSAIKSILCPSGTDPYNVEIDGQKYMLGQDKDQSGTINGMMEILGVTDTKENIFQSLKNLDKNNDGYVSQEELQANNIILTAIDNNGQLTSGGYDMSLVKGFNLAELQKTDGTNNVFGTFTMDLQDKKVNGNLTFEDDAYFNRLFGWDLSKIDNIDEDSSIAPITIPVTKSSTSSAVKTDETENTTEEAPSIENEETNAEKIETNDFSFNFTDASDNKSAIEKLLDQICWKLGITSISNSQKYSIIDNIDPNIDITIAEAEIKSDLDKFNLSA